MGAASFMIAMAPATDPEGAKDANATAMRQVAACCPELPNDGRGIDKYAHDKPDEVKLGWRRQWH